MKLVSLFARPLGVDSTPFGHSEKSIASAIIAGVAAVASSVIASAANSSSVSSTNAANLQAQADANATNKEIARETNEMSQAQFNSNMQWSREQFYKQREYALEDREYNSIQNQVQRAVAAGINPAAVIGNGSAAYSTTPVGSVGTPSQSNFQAAHMDAGHLDPVHYDFSGISEGVGHAIDAYQNSRLIDAQVENYRYDSQIKRADAATRLSENIARIRKIYSENQSLLASSNLSDATRMKIEADQRKIEQEMEYFEEVKDDLVRGVRLGNTRVEREMKHMDFEEMMEQYRVDIQRDLADSQISLNSANSALAIANEGKVAAERESIEYNNEVKSAADLVASTKAHLNEAQEQAAKTGVFKPLVTFKEYKAYKNALKHYNKVIYYAGKKHKGSKH